MNENSAEDYSDGDDYGDVNAHSAARRPVTDEDEDEFSYDGHSPAAAPARGGPTNPHISIGSPVGDPSKAKDKRVEFISNNHHDEAFDVSSEDVDEESASVMTPTPRESPSNASHPANRGATGPAIARPNYSASVRNPPPPARPNPSPPNAGPAARPGGPVAPSSTMRAAGGPSMGVVSASELTGNEHSVDDDSRMDRSGTDAASHYYGAGGPAGADPSHMRHPEVDASINEDDEEDGTHVDATEASAMSAMDPSIMATADNYATSASMYNPDDYKDLAVGLPAEIREMFDHIRRYKPMVVELETRLNPFVPDYIPAVGEIDAFIKVPPPDDHNDGLGLTVLDEPAVQQSDPTVLDITLRLVHKQPVAQPMTVRSIENAEKNPQKITNWIQNIQKLHREKPPPTVTYSKPMPSIESLMQVWPEEFEMMLKKTPLPSAEMDLTLQQYARVICSILDIPVQNNIIESLHVLFTLYLDFKSNQHFQP